MRFVDTNVLLYAVSTAADEREKSLRANAILAAHDITLSVQVLQEFYVQATRASRRDALTHDQAVALITGFRRFPVQETTAAVLDGALRTRDRFGVSYWDAAIIEAARLIGASEVLSEDLNDGQDYDGVMVRNPFVGDRHDLIDAD